MTNYILRFHASNVLGKRHSGYDLITEHDDGSKTIQYIDFSSKEWGDAIIEMGMGRIKPVEKIY